MSNSGEAFTENTGAEENYIYTWSGESVSARWVRVLLDSEAPGSHSLLSEIAVQGAGGSGGGVSEPLGDINYAAGMSYTAEPPFRTDWLGDAGGELTDGVTDWAWDPVTGWNGMESENPRAVTLDLGEVKDDIGGVAVTVFVSLSSAVPPQAQVLVLGSTTSATDGFTEWGEASANNTGAEENYIYIWTGGPVPARWVRVILDSEAPGSHSLLSEIEVRNAGTSAVTDWALYE